jgi:hypothetical protein
MNGGNFTPAKQPPAPTDYGLGETQSPPGRFGEEKHLSPYWESNNDPSFIHPAALWLYQPSYLDSVHNWTQKK